MEKDQAQQNKKYLNKHSISKRQEKYYEQYTLHVKISEEVSVSTQFMNISASYINRMAWKSVCLKKCGFLKPSSPLFMFPNFHRQGLLN